ncbi:M23 family metallopeptidase [Mycolicibacterium smegmatis]|uniref:M23 family metallopeptidase n=1 Tax=Mycolicibacterium smegmatis TaxID=1772 RepID=UPI001E318F49|nr:M23 family metallopeptidase [Mycolicibacterium smegmatis]UGU30540.1 M23 family metallopeptidase [Mycolicibacterium smegmatis]
MTGAVRGLAFGMAAMTRRLRALPALLIFVVTACTSPPAPVEQPTAAGQLTPMLVEVLSTPRWFTGTDGRTHLAYELLLTNVAPTEVNVAALEVRDADSGATLMSLSDDALREAMSLAASPSPPTTAVPSSAMTVVWLDVPSSGPPAAALTHRVIIDPPQGVTLDAVAWTFTTDPVYVDRRPPVVLGPPLAGPRWIALGSCCDGPHRRATYPIDGRWYIAQRYAIDFNLLDAQNRPGVGDPLLPSSFPTFGQPVYAVADGVIAMADDGRPDLRVGQARDEPTPQDAGGNRVAIDIGDGHYAIYAHLREGSIKVRENDRVRRGDHIADVGSSGTTGGPHLHFQVNDRPSVVYADGLPYVFDTFDVTGRTPPLDEILPYYDTLEPIPISTADTGPRDDQLPLGRDMLTFPSADG